MRLTWLVLVSQLAFAAPLRLAVVYGHNGGDGPRAALRFAEADAARFAQVLTEVGLVAPEDLKLLRGQPVASLLSALEWARGRSEGRETLLFLYVSTHADANRGLLPGREVLDWKTLKAALTATGARVRVAIIDGCESSGILETGARPAPSFTIEARESLSVKGEVFITSSASNEPSLEAGAFRGSVFTQHLVAGLRGSADRSGDGRVSLDEAYRFAFERTQEGLAGQHAGFANRLVGYGELPLTFLDRAGGLLLPDGMTALLVRDEQTREPVAYVRGPFAPRLALPPGRYHLELERPEGAREGTTTVRAQVFAPLELDQLGLVTREAHLVKLAAGHCLHVELEQPTPLLRAVASRLESGPCEGPVTLRLSTTEVGLEARVGARRERFAPGGAVDELAARLKAFAEATP